MIDIKIGMFLFFQKTQTNFFLKDGKDYLSMTFGKWCKSYFRKIQLLNEGYLKDNLHMLCADLVHKWGGCMYKNGDRFDLWHWEKQIGL